MSIKKTIKSFVLKTLHALCLSLVIVPLFAYNTTANHTQPAATQISTANYTIYEAIIGGLLGRSSGGSYTTKVGSTQIETTFALNPQILNFIPKGKEIAPTETISFVVTDNVGVLENNIHVTINNIDITNDLVITGTSTNWTVTYTPTREWLFGIEHSVFIGLTDEDNPTKNNIEQFYSFTTKKIEVGEQHQLIYLDQNLEPLTIQNYNFENSENIAFEITNGEKESIIFRRDLLEEIYTSTNSLDFSDISFTTDSLGNSVISVPETSGLAQCVTTDKKATLKIDFNGKNRLITVKAEGETEFKTISDFEGNELEDLTEPFSDRISNYQIDTTNNILSFDVQKFSEYGTAEVASVSIHSYPTTADIYTTVNMTINVFDSLGEPLVNAPINIETISGNLEILTNTTTTNTFGELNIQLRILELATVNITAYCDEVQTTQNAIIQALASSSNIIINKTQQTRHTTIEDAINKANSNDLIWLYYGNYFANNITISKPLTIEGAPINNPEDIVISANNTNRHFSISLALADATATVNFKNLTLTGGYVGSNQNGGSIFLSRGTLILDSIIATGNTADRYGGFLFSSAEYQEIIIRNSILTNNHAEGYTVVYGMKTLIENSLIMNNTAGDYGGPVGVAYFTFRNCTILNNTTSGYGGVSYGYSIGVENSIIWGNGSTNTYGDEHYPNFYGINYERSYFVNSIIEPRSLDGTSDYEWSTHRFTTNNFKTDPLLDSSYKPTLGSPAVDNGIFNKEISKDLANNIRPQGNGFDIGAYEYLSNIYIANFHPLPNEYNINPATSISIEITAPSKNIDSSNISLELNGNTIANGSNPGIGYLDINTTEETTTIIFTPESNFNYNEIIYVTINADNLIETSPLNYNYKFQIGPEVYNLTQDPAMNNPFSSLETAIKQAFNYDTIGINANNTCILTDQINIDKPLTIKGLGITPNAVISTDGDNRHFTINTTEVTFNNLTLTNGKPHLYGIIYGGSILNCAYNNYLHFENMIISDNLTAGYGGFISNGEQYLNQNNTPYITIRNSSLQNNIAYVSGQGNGGGIGYNGTWDIQNTVIANNFTSYAGGVGTGGIWNLKNCTLVNNTASNFAGIGYMSSWKLTNCILWGNTGGTEKLFYNIEENSYINNSIIQPDTNNDFDYGNNLYIKNNFLTEKNSTENPNLSADYKPQLPSPAIDKGKYLKHITKDLENTARPQGNGFDIGAYEYITGIRAANMDPYPDQYNVAYNKNIKFDIIVENDTIDLSSISLYINNQLVLAGDNLGIGNLSINHLGSTANIIFSPDPIFNLGEEINITINAQSSLGDKTLAYPYQYDIVCPIYNLTQDPYMEHQKNSLEQALGGANANDIIGIQNNNKYIIDNEIEITKSITIKGLGLQKNTVELTTDGDNRHFIINDQYINVTLNNLILSYGTTDQDGGSLLVANYNINLVIDSVIATKNSAAGSTSRGGFIHFTAGKYHTGSQKIINSIIANNYSENGGGAIYGGTWDIQNSIFNDNKSTYGGVFNQCNLDIRNSNFISNNATQAGGVIHYCTSHIDNSIFWNNYALNYTNFSNTPDDSYIAFSIVENNDCENIPTTENIITENPLFVDLTGRDFHLQLDSPAIDAGTSLNGTAPALDFDDTTRPSGLTWDIGAYERGEMLLSEYQPEKYAENVALTENISFRVQNWNQPSDNLQVTINLNGLEYYGNSLNIIDSSSAVSTDLVVSINPTLLGNTEYVVTLELSSPTYEDSETYWFKTEATNVHNITQGVDYPTIQTALDNANENDIIELEATTYDEGVTLNWPNIDNLTLRGNQYITSADAIISGENLYRIINIIYPVTINISNLSIINGFTNQAYGAAISIATQNATLFLTNVIFSDNEVSGTSIGGACIYGPLSNKVIADNCLFRNNTASFYGGVIQGTYFTATDSTFINNNSGQDGGVSKTTYWTATNCKFYSNHSTNGGVISGGTNTFKNCVFYDNSANADGGIAQNANLLSVENCTFYKNKASRYGSVFYSGSYNFAQIKNSIFWDNTENNITQNIFYNADLELYNSIVSTENFYESGDQLTENIIIANPLFSSEVSTNAKFLQLSHLSLAIDTGTTNVSVTTDILDTERPMGEGIDIGAYEYQAIYLSDHNPPRYSEENKITEIFSFRLRDYNHTPDDVAISVNINDTQFYGSSLNIIDNSGAIATDLLVSINYSIYGAATFNVTINIQTSSANTVDTYWFTSITTTNIYNKTQDLFYPTITAAVASADAGDIIELNDGTYDEGDQVTINTDVTIQSLSGISTNCIISGGEAHRLFTISNNVQVSFNNLSLQDGYAEDKHGGGLYINSNSIIKLFNCIVSNNIATANQDQSASGAFAYSVDETTKISAEKCLIANNKTSGWGWSQAAIGHFGTWLLEECIVTNNYEADGSLFYRTVGTANNCIFENNQGNAGGLFIFIITDPSLNWHLYNSRFSNNKSNSSGSISQGGYIYADKCTFDNNKNYGTSSGGITNKGYWTAKNCIFTNNYGISAGIAIQGEWDINQCTFYNNTSDYAASVFSSCSSLEIKNSIFWNNLSNGNNNNEIYGCIANITNTSVSSINYYYIDMGGSVTTKNIYIGDPRFVSTTSTDSDYLQLAPYSPYIDAGTSNVTVTTDITGKPRPLGLGYDLGAYEYNELYITERDPEPNQQGVDLLKPISFRIIDNLNPSSDITFTVSLDGESFSGPSLNIINNNNSSTTTDLTVSFSKQLSTATTYNVLIQYSSPEVSQEMSYQFSTPMIADVNFSGRSVEIVTPNNYTGALIDETNIVPGTKLVFNIGLQNNSTVTANNYKISDIVPANTHLFYIADITPTINGSIDDVQYLGIESNGGPGSIVKYAFDLGPSPNGVATFSYTVTVD